ncbi:MAG: hypothetical protein AAB834_04950 [Patescibacteria group bacterium]
MSPTNVGDMLSVFTVLPLAEDTVELASKRYGGEDFEDCLQIQPHIAGGCFG